MNLYLFEKLKNIKCIGGCDYSEPLIKIAKKVFNILKDKYDVYVNPTGGDREEYVLRVAHIGDTTIEDNKMLIDLLRKAIKEAKS